MRKIVVVIVVSNLFLFFSIFLSKWCENPFGKVSCSLAAQEKEKGAKDEVSKDKKAETELNSDVIKKLLFDSIGNNQETSSKNIERIMKYGIKAAPYLLDFVSVPNAKIVEGATNLLKRIYLNDFLRVMRKPVWYNYYYAGRKVGYAKLTSVKGYIEDAYKNTKEPSILFDDYVEYSIGGKVYKFWVKTYVENDAFLKPVFLRVKTNINSGFDISFNYFMNPDKNCGVSIPVNNENLEISEDSEALSYKVLQIGGKNYILFTELTLLRFIVLYANLRRVIDNRRLKFGLISLNAFTQDMFNTSAKKLTYIDIVNSRTRLRKINCNIQDCTIRYQGRKEMLINNNMISVDMIKLICGDFSQIYLVSVSDNIVVDANGYLIHALNMKNALQNNGGGIDFVPEKKSRK